jgi:hypothetical protein
MHALDSPFIRVTQQELIYKYDGSTINPYLDFA